MSLILLEYGYTHVGASLWFAAVTGMEAISMVLEKKGITPLLGYPSCQILSKRVIAVFQHCN